MELRILKDGIFVGTRPLKKGEVYDGAALGMDAVKILLDSKRAEEVKPEKSGKGE